MKKILFTLLMLCSMTIAWAGTGDGSKKYPFSGEWKAAEILPMLKWGKYLAYDCVIKSDPVYYGSVVSSDAKISVYDTGLDDAKIYNDLVVWSVSSAIDENPEWQYEDYCMFNPYEVRQTQMFFVDGLSSAGVYYYLSGHYTGPYNMGKGTEKEPYYGEWLASSVAKKIHAGDCLAHDFKIKDGEISIFDTKLNVTVAKWCSEWAVADAISDSPWSQYEDYCKVNHDTVERNKHKFYVSRRTIWNSSRTTTIAIEGRYQGKYEFPSSEYVEVRSFAELKKAVQNCLSSDGKVSNANIKLMADIYLTDNSDDGTLCNTFSGVLDGNGHTIWATRPEIKLDSEGRYNRNYLFTYSDCATFKNLTFKDIRKNSNDHSNQAIITSQAKNECLFENITFDNVSTWSNYNNSGIAAGYAYYCIFRNIKVLNSCSTVDDNYAACVVGDADKCTFTDIELLNCEATAYDDCAGGVVGHSRNCSFKNIDIMNCYIKVDGINAGGVAPKAVDGSTFENCVIDDQSVVYCNGTDRYANAGGVCGQADKADFKNCYNLGIVASEGEATGGIVGLGSECFIESCLNAGLIISIGESNLNKYIVPKYRAKQFKCINASNGNLSFTVQHLDVENINRVLNEYSHLGGIVGDLTHLSNIHNCANYSQIYNRKCWQSGGIAGNIDGCFTVDHNYNAPTAHGLPLKTGHGPMSDEPMDAPTFPDNMDWEDWGYFGGIAGTIGADERYTQVCFNVSADWHYITPGGNGNGARGSHNFMFTIIPYSDHFQGTPTVEEFYTGHMTSLINKDSREEDDNSPYIWSQDIAVDLYPKLHVKGRFFQPVDIPMEALGVYMTRTISNNYGTVCAPFKMKSDDNIKFYTFTKAESDEEGTALKFTYAEEVEKGTPVLFYSENTGEISFYNCGDTENAYSPDTVDVDQWSFRGVYRKTKFTGAEAQNVYYVSNGAIRNAKETTVDKFRAYFYGPSINSAAAKSIRFVLDEEDGSTTALNLSYDNENGTLRYDEDNTYTLMGTKAPAGYHGIVIKGGKKYIK